MIRRTEVPAGVLFREWINITGDELLLKPPGYTQLPPLRRDDGRLQITCADLAAEPELEAWLEGLELRGTLRQSDPTDR